MSQQKVKTILDDQKFKLTAKPIESGARPPTLQLATYFNNPQLTVFPNHDNGSGCTVINAGLDINTFGMVLKNLEYLIALQGEDQIEIENKRDIPKEKRTDPKVTKQVVSKIQMGKDPDGKVWISVLDNVKPNAPKIRFYFGINFYHTIRSKSGLTPGQFSQMQAAAWVQNAHTFMAGILLNNPNAEIDRAAIAEKFGNKGGGYGGNKGGNNYGGGKKSYGGNSNSNSGGAEPADDGFGGNFDDDDGDW